MFFLPQSWYQNSEDQLRLKEFLGRWIGSSVTNLGVIMNFRKVALGAALAVSTATMAHAGVIIAPVAATIDAGGPGSGSISNTFDQSGLSIGYTAGVTDFDTYIASGPTHTLTFGGYEWFSNYGTTSATVTYDFGALVTISALALWNEESSGIGHLNLTAPDLGTIASVDPVDVPYGDYGAQVFSFAPVTTRYLTFEMSNCPQNDPGSYQSCAIGEVAFNSGVAGGVPEPATWALMIGGFGMAGAALRRRRMVAA